MSDATTGQLLHDPVLKQRLRFERTVEDGQDTLLVETWVDPGGGVTPHIHPAMTERFEVLEGEVAFLSGKQWVTAGAGESVTVPPGTSASRPRAARSTRTDDAAAHACGRQDAG